MHYLYIIRCKNDSLYTGITWSLNKRIKEHNLGIGAIFTRNRRPVKIVYCEKFRTKKEAAKREKEIKGWRREKKEKLIINFKKSLH